MAKTLKTLSNILLGILSLALSYWFYRGHLEQYVHYIAHYGSYFQVLLNLVIIVLLSYFVYAFLKLLLTRKLKKQTLLLLCLLTLFSVESIQYFGHLGVFDLGDITLNMLGILVGTAIHQLPQFQTVIKKILS